MADQRIGGWHEVSQRGDIADFYNLIKNDNVKLLEHIDELPFVHTPLHISAAAGKIPFAIEMMKLKPSFISKPNPDGHTPIYFALLNGHTELVRQLLQLNADLVRVKGRECMTPLHYAATQIDVTTRQETALHIALKNDNLEAFKFLVGWVLRKWPRWTNILKQKDVEGNTILHIAISRNHTAVNHILGWDPTFFYVNEKNLEDKTALDILEEQQSALGILQGLQTRGPDSSEMRAAPDPGPDMEIQQTQGQSSIEMRHIQQTQGQSSIERRDVPGRGPNMEGQQTQGQSINDMRHIHDILKRAGALTASSLPKDTSSHEHYLELPGSCRRTKIIFFGNQVRKRIPDEKRNALLVVAALLVTVTYQAAITPPGALWQDDEANTAAPHLAGSAIARGTFTFSIFMAFNSFIFLSSIATMAVLVPPDDVVGVILAGVSLSLYFGYFSSLMIITQAPDWLARIVLISPVIIITVGYAFFISRKDRFDSHES